MVVVVLDLTPSQKYRSSTMKRTFSNPESNGGVYREREECNGMASFAGLV